MVNNVYFHHDHDAYDRDDHDHLVVGLRSPSVRKSAISPPRFADLSIVIRLVPIRKAMMTIHLQTDSEKAGLFVARPKR